MWTNRGPILLNAGTPSRQTAGAHWFSASERIRNLWMIPCAWNGRTRRNYRCIGSIKPMRRHKQAQPDFCTTEVLRGRQGFPDGIGKFSRRKKSSALFADAPLNRMLHQFSCTAQRELLLDVRLVGFDRLHADMQFLGNLPGGVALTDQPEDFQFAVRKICDGRRTIGAGAANVALQHAIGDPSHLHRFRGSGYGARRPELFRSPPAS